MGSQRRRSQEILGWASSIQSPTLATFTLTGVSDRSANLPGSSTQNEDVNLTSEGDLIASSGVFTSYGDYSRHLQTCLSPQNTSNSYADVPLDLNQLDGRLHREQFSGGIPHTPHSQITRRARPSYAHALSYDGSNRPQMGLQTGQLVTSQSGFNDQNEVLSFLSNSIGDDSLSSSPTSTNSLAPSPSPTANSEPDYFTWIAQPMIASHLIEFAARYDPAYKLYERIQKNRPHREKSKLGKLFSKGDRRLRTLSKIEDLETDQERTCGSTCSLRERRRRNLVSNGVCLIVSVIFFAGLIASYANRKTVSRLAPVIIEQNEAQRDTLVLYRIIGNDLPPRHSSHQTLTNLKFILEHEDTFEDYVSANISNNGTALIRKIEKHFLLNRIANQTQFDAVYNLLREHGIPKENILIERFDFDEYRQQSINFSDEPKWIEEMEQVWGKGSPFKEPKLEESLLIEQQVVLQSSEHPPTAQLTSSGNSIRKLRALDYTYHNKNLYAMNNNGGRNAALAHGRKNLRSRWILPLDGNCFFTPASMISLLGGLERAEEPKGETLAPSHVIIPMSRLLNNDQILSTRQNLIRMGEDERVESLRPDSPEEPQIGFRFDSLENFSNQMRYGHRSKLELLWRLGAIDRDRKLDRNNEEWELTSRKLLTPDSYGSIHKKCSRSESVGDSDIVKDFVNSGWVMRLFSGDQTQEIHSSSAITRRSVNRIKGIVSFIDSLDEAIARGLVGNPSRSIGFAPWRLWTIDFDDLEALKSQAVADNSELEHLRRICQSNVELARSMLTADSLEDMEGLNDLKSVSKLIYILTISGYLKLDEEALSLSIKLIRLKFLNDSHFTKTPNAFETKILWKDRAQRLAQDSEEDHSVGYLFPMEQYDNATVWKSGSTISQLPFDPIEFDSSLLLDSLRLIAFQSKKLKYEEISRLRQMMDIQTSYILFDSRSRVEDDLRLASLASFRDDARLLGRLSNRHQLRYRILKNFHEERESLVHEQLVKGFQNIRFRSSVIDENKPQTKIFSQLIKLFLP